MIMDQIERDILNSLSQAQPVMIEQLHTFCEINSGTENLAGLMQMATLLKETFTPLADEIRIVHMPPLVTLNMRGEEESQDIGSLLMIRKRPHLKRRVLLSGHMDTVYPEYSSFKNLTYKNSNHLNGPGVADMKGGLIVILHTLLAFEHHPFASSLGWDIIINADEEIGSPASAPFLQKIAPNYQAALVFEPTVTETGLFAKNRKGSGKFTLVASGKAAHVGRAFAEGKNAICYLAEVILAIHRLNQQREGITINVGRIEGGHAINIVPDNAVAKLDVRTSQHEDQQWFHHELKSIIKRFQRKGFSLKLHGNFNRPIKLVTSSTKRLFNDLEIIGQKLGLVIQWKNTGGCCDGNNLAHEGLPVIDTLGVRGGAIHSPQEYILLDSLVERASLNTLLLIHLAQGGLEDLNV